LGQGAGFDDRRSCDMNRTRNDFTQRETWGEPEKLAGSDAGSAG